MTFNIAFGANNLNFWDIGRKFEIKITITTKGIFFRCLRRTSTRCTRNTWRASWRTCGPSTARKWWPRAARPFSVRFCPATGGPTNPFRYRSRWSSWMRYPTAPWSLCKPATTKTRRPTCGTTGRCRPPAWPYSTTSGSSDAADEVSILGLNSNAKNRNLNFVFIMNPNRNRYFVGQKLVFVSPKLLNS